MTTTSYLLLWHLCHATGAAALDKQTKGSIHNTTSLYSFPVYTTRFCALPLPNPVLTPETHAQIFTENKWDQGNAPFLKLLTSSVRYLYVTCVKIYWQVKTHTDCAWCYLKSRQQHNSYSSFHSCVLLGAAEPGNPVCVTNPVSQACKQNCSRYKLCCSTCLTRVCLN